MCKQKVFRHFCFCFHHKKPCNPGTTLTCFSFLAFIKKKKDIYLFIWMSGWHRNRGIKESSFMWWFIPQMPAIARPELGQTKLEWGNHSCFPTWVAETWVEVVARIWNSTPITDVATPSGGLTWFHNACPLILYFEILTDLQDCVFATTVRMPREMPMAHAGVSMFESQVDLLF